MRLGNGCGHNGHKNRNLMIGTVGLLPEEFGSYIEQMEMTWAQKLSRNNLNEIRRVIVSFSKNELSKDKPEDIELAMQMCQEFVQDAYDGHDALICLSADGVGEKLHAHILVNNVSSRDFKGCTREQTHFSYVKSNWNRIQSKYVTIDLGKGPKEKISQNERRMRDENRRYAEEGLEGPNYIWKDDLRNRIRIAMNTASSKEEFIDTLEKNGVVAKTRKEGKPGTYYNRQIKRKIKLLEEINLNNLKTLTKILIEKKITTIDKETLSEPLYRAYLSEKHAIDKAIQLNFTNLDKSGFFYEYDPLANEYYLYLYGLDENSR